MSTASIKIKVVNVGGSIKPSTQANAVTVTSASGVALPTRLDSLIDVVEGVPQNNSTLVYYSANDTYVVEQLNLDGGSF
jgi:hypothetical protein